MPEKENKKKNSWCETDQHTLPNHRELLAPGPGHRFEVIHDHRQAVQFDFYIPVAIYYHTATRRFITRIGTLARGATLFRGASGVWSKQGERFEEDVYIYRLIVEIGQWTPDNLRPHLETEVRELIAEVGEWRESRQHLVIFTETIVCLNKADLANPPNYTNKQTDKPPKKKKK